MKHVQLDRLKEMRKKWLVLKKEFLEEYMDILQKMKCTEEKLMEKLNKFIKNQLSMHTS